MCSPVNEFGNLFKTYLSENVRNSFSFIETNKLSSAATVIDPKKMVLLSDQTQIVQNHITWTKAEPVLQVEQE